MENVNTQVVEKKKLTETEMKSILDKADNDTKTLKDSIASLEKQLETKKSELAEKLLEVKDTAKKWIAIQEKKFGINEPKVRKSGGGRPKKVVETTTTTETTK